MFINTQYPSPLLPFAPMAVGRHQKQSLIIRPNGFEQNQIHWVEEGTMPVKIGGESRLLRAGEGFFFRKNVPHEYGDRANPATATWVCFLNGDELLEYYKIKDYFFFTCPEGLSADAVKLSDYCENESSEILVAAEGYRWAARLFNSIFQKPKSMCDEINIFLDRNFDRPLSLDEIAQAAGTDKFNLCRIFKEGCGMTVMQSLKIIRIRKAKHMLWQTSLPVEDIALMCGFQDTSYFIKNFKELVGETPNKYRSKKFGKAF